MPPTTPNLASLGRASFAGFERLLEAFGARTGPEPSPNHSPFLQEFQRFRIWAVDIGLLVPGHGSLDYRLRDNENLTDTYKYFLQDLIQNLRETLEFADPSTIKADASSQAEDETFHNDDGDSSFESDNEDEDKEPQWYIEILLKSITGIVDDLFQMSILVRNPATRLISSKADSHCEVDSDSGIDLIDAFSHTDHDYVLSVVRECESPCLPNSVSGNQTPT
jgi:hypothetical protein